jgi:hypothetical protein
MIAALSQPCRRAARGIFWARREFLGGHSAANFLDYRGAAGGAVNLGCGYLMRGQVTGKILPAEW